MADITRTAQPTHRGPPIQDYKAVAERFERYQREQAAKKQQAPSGANADDTTDSR